MITLTTDELRGVVNTFIIEQGGVNKAARALGLNPTRLSEFRRGKRPTPALLKAFGYEVEDRRYRKVRKP